MRLTAKQVYSLLRGAGATHDEAVMLTAISKGESGWNTQAHNPDRSTGDNSYGLLQINMIEKYQASRLKQHGLPNNEALFNPFTNARVALTMLRQRGDYNDWTIYKDKVHVQYLPEVQQAAYEASANNTWKGIYQGLQYQDFGVPATGAYTGIGGDPVVGDGGGGGGGAPAPTGPPKLAPNASEAEIVKFIEENYGLAAKSLLQVPELRAALLQAAQDGAVGERAKEYYYKTRWWTDRTQAMREWDMLELADPRQAYQRVIDRTDLLKPMWESLGVDEDIGQVARDFERLGLNEAQLNQRISTSLQKESSKTGLNEGTIAEVGASDLMRIARMEYLTPIDRQTAERWAIKAVRTGQDVEASFRDYMASISSGRFGIDPNSGITGADMLSPVRMAIAESLEINPDTIDLLAPEYADVMQVEAKDGSFRPMTASEAMKWARSQESFKGTSTAEKASSGFSELLLKTFGKVG